MRALKIALCALLVLGVCATGFALAERGILDRYAGGWTDGETSAYFRYDVDDFICRITRDDGEDTLVWEFDGGWYDEEAQALVFMNCERYREHIDMEALELVEEDWSLIGLAFAEFKLSEDGKTVTCTNIAGIDQPLILRWEKP